MLFRYKKNERPSDEPLDGNAEQFRAFLIQFRYPSVTVEREECARRQVVKFLKR